MFIAFAYIRSNRNIFSFVLRKYILVSATRSHVKNNVKCSLYEGRVIIIHTVKYFAKGPK